MHLLGTIVMIIEDLNGWRVLDFLQQMEDPRKEALIAIYRDHQELFHTSKGSGVKHHAWEGGYADHLAETFRIFTSLFRGISAGVEPPKDEDGEKIKESSGIFCLFFHDCEKWARYADPEHPLAKEWHARVSNEDCTWHDVQHLIFERWQEQYGFSASEEELNALRYVHGEPDNEYNPVKRVMRPLAAFVHSADTLSARTYPNRGKGLG